jgi:DNA repair exonuclease SbcCD ATPase subunit
MDQIKERFDALNLIYEIKKENEMIDSLEVCEHLIHKSLPCEFCKLHNKISTYVSNILLDIKTKIVNLETKYNKLNDSIINPVSQFFIRINNLETRLKELEDWTRADETLVKNKLKKLETKVYHCMPTIDGKDDVCYNIENICNETDALQIRLKELESKINSSNTQYRQQPFKCPVCEGNCMLPNPLIGIDNAKMPVNLDCIVCDGKGVIWG